MKRCMSVMTAMILSLCIIIAPITTVTAVDKTIPTNTDEDSSVSGSTSIDDISIGNSTDFGDLLNNEISEKEAERQENMGNNIFSVEIENNVAKVEFETTESSTIVVGIYDEQGIQMVTSANSAVTPGQKNASIELDSEKVPEYFYIKAFIVDSDTLRPMCTVYESPNYTKEMQEFFAMTTDDFEEEQVLNLDASKQNNFAVYKDSTIVIQKKANANIVVSADSENNIYVIQNPDDTLRGLQAGDIFAYDYSDEDIIIAKVAQTVINGDTITITGTDDFDISDVFDYIKLDQSATEQYGEGQKTTSTSAGTNVWDLGKDKTYPIFNIINYSDEKTIKDDEDNPTVTISFKISLNGKISGYFKYFLHLSDQYIEFKLESEVKVTLEASGKVQAVKIPLQKLGVGIEKVFDVDFSPCFEVTISGAVNLSGTVKNSQTIRVDTQNGFNEQHSNNFIPQSELNLTITVFIGLTFEPKISVFEKAEVKASLKAGIEISGKLATHKAGERHSCCACIDGDVKALLQLSFSSKLGKNPKITETPIKFNPKIYDFYYSIDYKEFGTGECPHKEYKCTVTVKDDAGNPVSGALINNTYGTDPNGMVYIYINPGNTINLTARKDNLEGKYEGVITSPTAITITLSQEYIIAKGDREQCHWEIDKNGKLTISGIIPDIEGDCDTPWCDYRHIIKEVYVKPNTKTSSKAGYLFQGFDNVTKIDLSNLDTSATTDMTGMFMICPNLTSLNLSGFNTSNVIDMTYMFGDCGNLKTLDISNFDTSKVTNMSYMFNECNNLQSLDISHFDTSNVIDMTYMFFRCWNLVYLDVSHFDTSNVTDMTKMFEQCGNLKTLDVSNFNTSKVTNMSNMFCGCGNLKTLDVNNFDTSKVTNMANMFGSCYNLKTLDISNFDTSKVTNMINMFRWCNNLKTIIVGGSWNTNNLTNDGGEMFNYCFSLIGGAGTTYDGNIDKTYAHIDGGTSNPGYLTAKTQTTSTSSGVVTKKTTSTSANAMATQMTKSYIDLEPNETYNFYVMKDVDTEEPLSSDNLYYITQAQADENGGLLITYAPTEDYETAESFVVAYHRKNVAYAQATAKDLTYTAEEQYIKPTVILDDVQLVEGIDYELTNEYSATDIGEYTVTVRGMGDYTGTINVTYNIVKLENLSSVEQSAIDLEDSITILPLATGGVGQYTYSCYFRKSDIPVWNEIECSDNSESIIFEPDEAGRYYIRVDVTDENNVTDKKAIVVNVAPTALVNDSNISADSVKKDEVVILQAKAAGGTKSYEYVYYYKNILDDSWILLDDYSTNDTYHLKFNKGGIYDICIGIKDTNETVAKKYFVVDVEEIDALENTSVILSDNIKFGETIDIKASATGGKGSYQYAAYYKKATDTKWVAKQGFKENADISIKPANAAIYDICVKVQDESGEIVKQYFKVNVTSAELLNTSTLSADKINLGETITVTAKADGGSGSYTYGVYSKISTSSKWTENQSFKNNTTVSIKPDSAAAYDICVKVKDSKGTITKKYFTVAVSSSQSLANTSSVSSDSINLGDTFKTLCSATGGTGSYTYAVYYKKSTVSKWVEHQSYQAVSTVFITPTEKATYDICIKVKDSKGTIEKQYLTVTVK